jgi:hypothetical protein
VKERALHFEGLKSTVIRFQQPGCAISGLLGPDDDIARFEYSRNRRNFGSVLIGIRQVPQLTC